MAFSQSFLDEINQTYAFRKDYCYALENSGLQRGNDRIIQEILRVIHKN